MSTALTIADRLNGDAFQAEIARVLPKHLSPERMARVALTAIRRVPKLAKCDQGSFFKAMMDLSQWGLEPDGRRAHLIPFGKECQLIIDYKGLVELAMRSGMVSSIHADIVCENDKFLYDRGVIEQHTIDFKNPRGEMYAVYCIVRYKDGAEKTDVMSREEVDAIRKRSKAGNSGPWVTDYPEMAKKTVFRRLSKWLPLTADFRDAVDGDDDAIVIDAGPATTTSSSELNQLLSIDEQDEEGPIVPDWQSTLDDCEAIIAESGDADAIRKAFAKLEVIAELPVEHIKRLGNVMNERLRELV